MVSQIPGEKKFAQQIVKKYSLSPPVDIRKLINNYATCVEDLLPNNADAICIINIEKPLIILDSLKSENRKRFTLAHELGHIIIPWHDGMISCHTDEEDVVDGNAYQTMEAEANSFAAEILMPSEWLKGVIDEHKEEGLQELLTVISEGANVSVSAAFYSLIHYLPDGYIILMENSDWYFAKFRRSKYTNILIPKQSEQYDLDWLDNCSNKKGSFNLESTNITWWKTPETLTEDKLINLLEQSSTPLNLNYIFEKIINTYGNGALATSLQSLVEQLPHGYLIHLSGGDYKRTFRTPNTRVPIPDYRSAEEEINWIQEYSNTNGTFNYLGYTINWGYFVISAVAQPKKEDKRLSPDILKGIINDCYQSEADRKKYTQSINGVIGFLNNVASREFDEFYRIFKERFIGVEKYRKISQHRDFDIFVRKKIKEILSRKK
ncbi:ImmA/IrrE family metallo-endopeptidase [Fredinandcohnia sp. 179-A 10B2 NHS]|uniref:ImmA/IrrE family metallo-endopeptidase n=1 Tax=Fredinandcohnia sp. 179-A 10B2 NHS TaxID=3235176 RepID=UPI0039A22597